MARNSAIAKRMQGPKSESSASRSYSNYRKILFSPDDMASFENLLDQVEDADRPRYKPPVETSEEQPGAWCTKLNIAVLVVASVFVAAFAVGWGPVPWTLCSEIFPMRVRSRATSVTTATNWLANTLLGKAFPLLPLATAFGLFALVCVCGVTLSYLAQPETANLSLEQIDVGVSI